MNFPDAFEAGILTQKGPQTMKLTKILKNAAPGATHVLHAALGTPPPAEKSAPTAIPAPPSDGLTELVVWAVAPLNRNLLICHYPEKDGSNPMNLVNVTVRTNVNFLKGMTLRARQVSDKKFSLEGACPRMRGKW